MTASRYTPLTTNNQGDKFNEGKMGGGTWLLWERAEMSMRF